MDEPIPDASQTNPGNWKYISEGRSTIVFSYDGPAHPLYTGTVLRVRKFRLGLSSEARDSPSVAFHNKIISKLVKHEFLPTLRSVSVGQEWLKQLHDLEDQNRPSERRNSGSIDFHCRMAVLATNLVGNARWAVEIKVRTYFAFPSKHIHHELYVCFSQSGDFSRTLDTFLTKPEDQSQNDVATACILI